MSEKILNIAHRGARSLAPENTIAAAKKAHDIGADLWELDCGMLSDDSLIVLHDDNFKRTTNINEVFPERANNHLSTFNLNEVQQLDAGSFFLATDPFSQISEGAVSQEEQEIFRGLTVPTLEEALVFTKENHWQVNVEIKNMRGTPGDEKIVKSVIQLIQSLKMQSQVIISSFNHRYLQQCKAVDENIRTATLVGLPKLWDVKKTLNIRGDAYHPPVYAITKRQIQRARKKGLAVNIWTVNETEKMRSLIDAGATGIITDFPQRMKELLENI